MTGYSTHAGWREKLKRNSDGHELRVRVPQIEDTVGAEPDDESEDDEPGPESPESDVEFDDGEDSDEDEDGDDPKSTESGPAPTATGFTTLVPPATSTGSPQLPTNKPPGERGTTTTAADAISTVPPPESIVNSLTIPTTLISSTLSSEPIPISSLPADEGTKDLIPTATTAKSSDTGAPSSIPSGNADQFNNGGSGNERLSRGEEAGIVVGTLVILSILIAAGIFFYRRRKKAKDDRDHVFSSEKALPDTPPDNPPMADDRGRQFNSWDMFVPPAVSGGRKEPATRYYMADKKEQYMKSMWSPDTPEPPAAAPRGTANLGIYPPGQVPIGQFRVPSMARTNTSNDTEETWRTWNVDQKQASKKPWTERYLG